MPSDIKLKKRLYGQLPALLMQRGHLAEILVNLLLNAREALAGQGNVSIAARCNPQYAVEITVADDGPGIAPDKIGRIFEAYFTTKEKGTGLGLAIVKHNAELYGGAVRVESELGKGAKFTVILPMKSQPKPFIQ
jgi:signal transduction histidine kinase